eukprot:Hpha_TRINITY_DN4378_c0_g1::TRINITY_DN4378_c0_g1_i1::g.50107::m.50107
MSEHAFIINLNPSFSDHETGPRCGAACQLTSFVGAAFVGAVVRWTLFLLEQSPRAGAVEGVGVREVGVREVEWSGAAWYVPEVGLGVEWAAAGKRRNRQACCVVLAWSQPSPRRPDMVCPWYTLRLRRRHVGTMLERG